MRLDWSYAARSDLRGIHHYWKCRASEAVADRIVDSIIERATQLLQFPEMGHALHDRRYVDARELLERPYCIRYRITESAIEIIAVIHGASLR